jgi:hypothetical protein
MYRAFTMLIIRCNITAWAAVGIKYACGLVESGKFLQVNLDNLTGHYTAQARTDMLYQRLPMQ